MRYFITLFLLGAIVGCTPKTPYVPPFEGERIFVESYLGPSEIATVYVGRTFAIGEVPKITYLDNAEVELWQNGVKIEVLTHKEKGVYQSPSKFKPKAGSQYALKISVSGFPSVESESVSVPAPYPLQKIETFEATGINKGTKAMGINIIPKTSQRAYYGYRISTYLGAKLFGLIWEIGKEREVLDKCQFRSILYFTRCGGSVSYGFETERDEYAGPGRAKITSAYAELYVLSQSYYDFHYNQKQQPTYLGRAFVEPFESYTNIKGGYGVLATFNKTEVRIPL